MNFSIRTNKKNDIHVCFFFLISFLSLLLSLSSHWSNEHCTLLETNATHSICRCRPAGLSICTILAIGVQNPHHHQQRQQQQQSTYNLTSLVCVFFIYVQSIYFVPILVCNIQIFHIKVE